MRDACSILVAAFFFVAGLAVSLLAGAGTVGASAALSVSPGALFLAGLSLFLAGAVTVSCLGKRLIAHRM